MANRTTIVHATHEAVGKVGGIGAVLHGFFTCDSYLRAVERSILVSPLFTPEGPVEKRLGENGKVLYSSMDGITQCPWASSLRKVENRYNAPIIYGRVSFTDTQTGITSSPEVLLVDVRNMDDRPVDDFKRQMFEVFAIRSDLYEHLWEYEQYVRLAPAAIDAVKAIGAAGDETVVIAHEFMGMPTALAATLDAACDFRTVFYAHEVATMRRIVEGHPGHDTMFGNILRRANGEGLYVTDLFGEQAWYFKHVLVKAAKSCDAVFAVGDCVAKELGFLAPEFETTRIATVYNGIPACQIGLEDKLASKDRVQRYCKRLLGFRPDLVFTHVTRMIVSKGLWRDLRVLYKLEGHLRRANRTAVFYLLSTQVSQRDSSDIENMEAAYGWPVAHREGWPDMSGGEADFYTAVQRFNAHSRNIKVVFINQFFSGANCGRAMPEDMSFTDMRMGTDVEFGQSVYEPFGISQFEPLTFGGICVVSNICGCLGFLRDVTKDRDVRNVIVADYTNLDGRAFATAEDLLQINRKMRDRIEEVEAERVAREVLKRLAANEAEMEHMINAGYELARNMSWDVVVQNYLLPGLRALEAPTRRKVCAG